MDYDNRNKGVLFNEATKKSENHPEWTGKLDVEGKEYRIAAWERTTKTGQPILSLAISEPRNVTDAPTGYEQAKAKAQEIKSRQVDTVADMPEDDEPIDLSEIPF
jgi:uncharacterized protein (DUF736 family)